MKLRIVTLAALAALAGQAFAAVTPNNTPVTAVEASTAVDTLYLSGSSAAKAIITGLLTQNCTGYTSAAVPGSYISFTDASGQYNVYACRLTETNDWGLPANTVVVINKRDDQGSGFGVFPVATNTPVAFLDLTKKDGTTGKFLTSNHTADAGISDVEPTLFNNAANRPAAFKTAAPVDNTSSFKTVTITQPDTSTTDAAVIPVFAQVFGVAVTNKLYAALQTAQGTTGVPSLPRDYLSTLFSSQISSIGWQTLGVANETAGVNICFRDQGSGTRVAGNLFLGSFPANSLNGFSPLNGSYGNSAAKSDAASKIFIDEAGSGSGVGTCLNGVNGLSIGYGVGLLALADEGTGWKFVAIDGVVPTRDAAKTGKYGFWVESTMQVNKSISASPAAQAWLLNFIAKAQQSTNLAQLSSSGQKGVFALPLSQADATHAGDDCSVYAGTYSSTVSGATAADKFCGRYNREGLDGVDNRLAPVFIK